MRAAWLLAALSCASACTGDDDAEPTLEERCAAADEDAGIVRPAGWAALSHCKFAPADVAKVFPDGTVGKLTLRMSAAEYAAMQADLDELMGGGDGGDWSGDGGPVWDPGEACEGKSVGEVCETDPGNGLEPGVCLEWLPHLGCFPDSWRAPASWRAACEDKNEGDACTTEEFDSVCGFDGVDTVCFPPNGPGENPEEDPCAGKADGDACTIGSEDGACASTTGLRVCEAALDHGDVSDVPDEAAAAFWPREPKYFHAELEYAGATFSKVGVRYKGNNGLASADGEKKPFRLKLDEWEDEDRAVTDQRIFGFQDLSFSPNQTDGSNLHQVLAAEAFRGQGLPASYAGFVEVYLDTGSGERLLGLYAMSELPDDQLPERAFGSEDGNLYKPDGRGAHFLDYVQASMHKRNNDASTYDDVIAFVDALNGPVTDRAVWRAALQASFDMEGFARVFAVNQAIANWDTYGALAHNFYLYNDAGRLSFIPWDFDLAFESTGASDLGLRSFDGRWPLLQALARDATFFTLYTDALADFAASQLEGGQLEARVETLAALIRPAVEREDAVRPGVLERFDLAIEELGDHLRGQAGNISQFLASQDPKNKPVRRQLTVRDALLRGPHLAAKARWRLAMEQRAR